MGRDGTATTILVTNKLSKTYSGSTKAALDSLSISVKSGEVYGFLGPNGAGKSTTIRLLMNFIQPTSGGANILGFDVVKNSVEIKKSVGYLSGDFAVYPKLTGAQFLSYMSALQPPSSKAYLQELIKRLKAEPDKKMGELSRGNRQKFGIIQAFMHQPRVLILDEPTSGLDPLMQEEFYKLIAEARERGAIVFMSSHILAEVQKTCDRVGIIRDGKLVDEQRIADMAREASQTFDITFDGKIPMKELQNIPKSKVTKTGDSSVMVHIHGPLKSLFAVLAKENVTKIDARAIDLEELFLGFYEKGAKK